jgi:uncharacterized protein
MKGSIIATHCNCPEISGVALVSTDPISFLGGVNSTTGTFIDDSYGLKGECFKGKILVYPTGKGSTGDMVRIWRCKMMGVTPMAVINTDPDIIQMEGWVFADIPVVFGCEEDPTKVLKTGDKITIKDGTIYYER